MSLQLIGVCEYTLEETVRLDLFDGVVDIHSGAHTNNAMKVLAVSAEAVAIWKKNQGVLPADEFAAHGKNGAVGVYGTLLVEHFDGGLDGVEDHDVLTEDLDMGDVAWGWGREFLFC